MIHIPCYNIDKKIHHGKKTIIYSGIRMSDSSPVLLKLLSSEYPNPSEIARLKMEYELNKRIHSNNIVKIYDLENYEKTPVLIFEDFGGEPLKKILHKYKKLNLTDFFNIAISLSEGLIDIYNSNIIHKSINPNNIIVNLKKKLVKLTNFENASLFSQEINHIDILDDFSTSLDYISPEQTGRMNRKIDYSTDFYSLGILFYEMLTGSLPFKSNDKPGMIHCHLAVQPLSPFECDTNIPKVVSDIVMKLMEKMPEKRYKSAMGLKLDLQKCIHSIEKSGTVKHFKIGKRDISDVFYISDKLYGREHEIKLLESAIEKISDISKQAIMVTGYSGTGKSKLVNKVRSSVKNHSGYFISGKFDQFEHDIPYSALIYSFKDLVRQILSENEQVIDVWRKKILNSLGSNGQIVINVIPELELIIGKQNEVIEVSAEETKNRFFNVFKDFVKTFCSIKHPLIIFLDDLQWADLSSLKLIEILMSDSRMKNLLFIGSYRDNEVNELHPLSFILNNIQKENVPLNKIVLKPLDLHHIQHLLTDTFHCNFRDLNLLSELTQEKTEGNPFFLNQFLHSLYNEQLITFNKKAWKWEWNLQDIQSAQITDNVVELISRRISKFSSNSVEVLKLAACIGNQFDLDTLAIISKGTIEDTYSKLSSAIKESMISPIETSHDSADRIYTSIPKSFSFLHDRIQQAAYSLIEENHRKSMHLKIGQLMLSNIDVKKDERKILDIVNQLNIGIDLVHIPFKKKEIAKLELIAGRIAKKSTAYDTAYKYILIGINLMKKFDWNDSYELIHSLYVEGAEIACLIGNFEAVEKYSKIALSNSKTILDKVKIYEIKIISYTLQNKKLEVLDNALFVLKLLGLNFPKKPNLSHVLISLAKTKLMLIGKTTDSLFELPKMSDSFLSAALRIMVKMGMSTYMLNPNLFLLITLKGVRLYIKHGNLDSSSIGYAAYGMLSCCIGDIDSGYKFGQLSLKLLDEYNAKEYNAQTLVLYNCFITPWKLHTKDTLNEYTKAYFIGLETGNINYACTSACLYCISAYYSGHNLIHLERTMSEYIEVMNNLKNKEAFITQSIYHQSVLNLIGPTTNASYLKGKIYDEDKMMPIHLEEKDRGTVCNVSINKSILSYLFCEYENALENSNIAKKYLDGVSGTLSFSIFYFYNSLILLANFNSYKSLFRKQKILHSVSMNQQKLKKWALQSEKNYLHKFYLVQAEKSKILGKTLDAIDFYEKAIKLASDNEYIQEEALANELTAKFYLSLGNKKVAKVYLEQAVYCYTLWGAASKVDQLRDLYDELFTFHTNNYVSSENINNELPEYSILLDTSTIIKATRTISSEIKLNELLKKLIYIVLENAGAQRVCYLIKKDGKYVIQAEGNIDENNIEVLKEIDLETSECLPKKIVYYVDRSRDSILLNDAYTSDKFKTDPYILYKKPKSIMCMPILSKGKLIGILYLENNLIEGVFNKERIEILKIIASQLAISLENSTLYANLERSEKQLRKHQEQLEELIETRTAKLKEEIIERKKAQKLLEEMATHDSLTGLPNRKLFYTNLNHSLQLAQKTNLLLAILFVDLDGFKEINDIFGHDSGDIVLQTISERLLKIAQECNMVSRFGGDEFIVIIESLKIKDSVNTICKRIINEVSKAITLGENEGYVTASIGISIFPDDGNDMNTLIKKADNAMYVAKRSGKNKFVFY